MSDVNKDLDNIFGPQGGNGISPEVQKRMLMVIGSAFNPMVGGTPITGDEVDYHDAQKIILPKGWSFAQAMATLERLHEEAETETQFKRQFNYRPDDGAVATSRVLRDRYGMTLGETIDMGFFGVRRPESRTVAIDHNQKVQVPWGKISIPTLPGISLTLCEGSQEGRGSLFHLHVVAAKKHKADIESIFDAIEEELKTNSIYRGKALSGSNKLEFIDVSTFNAREIVFSTVVTEQLEAGVWAPIRYTDAFREEGLRTKRTALLHGPYGTGKSSAGLVTAQIAIENGWTFLSARTGEDNIRDVLATAKLYQPAVVFVEDIDTQTSMADGDSVSELLEAFDGITAKGGELVVVMTTNHKERIHKGMFRPGRLDCIIEINSLDRDSVEKLIAVTVPEGKLDTGIDFDEVFSAMEGFYPAFVREAVERAKVFAVSRGKGARNYTLTALDLVKAAHTLKPQLDELNGAKEGEAKPDLESALSATVTKAAQQVVHGTYVDYNQEGDQVLRVPGMNGSDHS